MSSGRIEIDTGTELLVETSRTEDNNEAARAFIENRRRISAALRAGLTAA